MKSIRLHDWEVRAIQAGATQIRRLVKAQPHEGATIQVGVYAPMEIGRNGIQYPGDDVFGAWSTDGEWDQKSPFGKPGDVLIHKATGLEIVTKAVRVERVQEISEKDAVACGMECYDTPVGVEGGDIYVCPQEHFKQKFTKDNGPDSWGRNEYVWVGEIERKDVQ